MKKPVFQSINPYDQQVFAAYDIMAPAAVVNSLDRSDKAFRQWRKTQFAEKAALMMRVADLLLTKKDALAEIISKEMGKLIAESRAEIEKCAWNCRYFAEQGENMLHSESVSSDAAASFVRFDPLGAVFAIMPWNFPFWQVFRFAAPTLMAGNVILLKHAPNVCGCSLAIADLFQEAGFPEGVFQSLIVDVGLTEKIIASDIVQGVTLTGSESAGSSVASLAGKHIKKTVLELGGSDAFIVLDDADTGKAAQAAVTSRMANAGQSCIAAKRFIVTGKVKEAFLEKMLHITSGLKQGDPMKAGTTIAPLARLDLTQNLDRQLQDSLSKNARLLTGGNSEGCLFQPTIIDRVKPGMPAFDEETFGPMANIITAANETEAIALANLHRYGLGASLWTEDLDKAQSIAADIQSGSVFINAPVKSDPRLPFGGIKKSGYGRELSEYGMKEFVNFKTVYIAQ